jgi:hypothetical protein
MLRLFSMFGRLPSNTSALTPIRARIASKALFLVFQEGIPKGTRSVFQMVFGTS